MKELRLDGLLVHDPDVEGFVRRYAATVIGDGTIDLTDVIYGDRDESGLTIVSGVVRITPSGRTLGS